MTPIRYIDTHTAGEPTRVVVSGGPNLGAGSLADRRQIFAQEFDESRSAIVQEPRGSDVLVGALLVPPVQSDSAAGVVFFNNVGMLGMCGHGMIGVAVALARLGRIGIGRHIIETPVGNVTVELENGNSVAIENVPSYRLAADVVVDVPGIGPVSGDIAWGGNWFFLTEHDQPQLQLANVDELTQYAWRIRQALERNGITGEAGGVIDHIELCGPPAHPANHARNFVLCPGKAYDRSPCGTGTSAKLACLAADNQLQPAELWRQEGILGTVFEGCYRCDSDHIVPTIRGSAYIVAEGKLIFDPADPFCRGIRP